MSVKIKSVKATKNYIPLKHSPPSPGQNKIDWSQVTILSFWPPGSCLAETEENCSCFTNGLCKALLVISLWVRLDSVETSA